MTAEAASKCLRITLWIGVHEDIQCVTGQSEGKPRATRHECSEGRRRAMEMRVNHVCAHLFGQAREIARSGRADDLFRDARARSCGVERIPEEVRQTRGLRESPGDGRKHRKIVRPRDEVVLSYLRLYVVQIRLRGREDAHIVAQAEQFNYFVDNEGLREHWKLEQAIRNLHDIATPGCTMFLPIPQYMNPSATISS